MMDINCLSSGSTLLIKVDSITLVQNQLDKFLEKFAKHEKIYHDPKLPLFIVNSFLKLFRHWLEFPDLKSLIGEDAFEEIFNEMANVFELRKLDHASNPKVDTQFDCFMKEETNSSNLKGINHFDSFLKTETNSSNFKGINPSESFLKREINSSNFKSINPFDSLKKKETNSSNLKGISSIDRLLKKETSSISMKNLSPLDSLSKEENNSSNSKVSPLNSLMKENPFKLNFINPLMNSPHQSSSKSESSSSLKSKSSSTARQNLPVVSYFKIFCNECNDTIEMVNDDPSLSYNLHIQSEQHMKCYDCYDAESLVSTLKTNDTEDAASPVITTTSKSRTDSETSNSTDSSDSDDSENVEPAASQYKLPTLYDPFCEPCCKKISTKELFIGKHVESKSHETQVKLYEECQKILQKYGYFFSITNKDIFEFRCHICMKKQIGTNCFIQHCRGIEHLTNLEGVRFAGKK